MIAVPLIAACLVGQSAPPPSQPEVAAYTLAVTGTVTVRRGVQAPQLLKRLDQVRDGDRLESAVGATSEFAILKDGAVETLLTSQTATMKLTGCHPAAAVKREANRITGANLEAFRGLARSGRIGASIFRSDPNNPPPHVSPIKGAVVLGDRPNLSWPAVAGATGYRLILHRVADGTEEKPLISVRTTEPQFLFSAEKPALARKGKFSWRVGAEVKAGDPPPPVVATFVVASTEAIESLKSVAPLAKSESPSDWALAALLYESMGIYDFALPLYEKLAARHPQDGRLQKVLAYYYMRAGRPDLARIGREKAKTLGETFPDEAK